MKKHIHSRSEQYNLSLIYRDTTAVSCYDTQKRKAKLVLAGPGSNLRTHMKSNQLPVPEINNVKVQ